MRAIYGLLHELEQMHQDWQLPLWRRCWWTWCIPRQVHWPQCRNHWFRHYTNFVKLSWKRQQFRHWWGVTKTGVEGRVTIRETESRDLGPEFMPAKHSSYIPLQCSSLSPHEQTGVHAASLTHLRTLLIKQWREALSWCYHNYMNITRFWFTKLIRIERNSPPVVNHFL